MKALFVKFKLFQKWLRNSFKIQILALIFILSGAIFVSVSMGYVKIPCGEIIKILLYKISGEAFFIKDINDLFSGIVLDVRLPRILTAAIVGSGLALSGVVFQGILLNPLADPYTLGVSSGAAFGASLALFFNFDFCGVYSVSFFAFLGAVLTLVFVLFLSFSGKASLDNQFSSNNLILSGIIVTAILSAGINFLKFMADEQVSVIIFWLMGSFNSKTWTDVLLTLVFVCTGFLIFLFYAMDLNLMSLGNKMASSLGVDTKKTPFILLVASSLVTAVCVSVSGIIGFVGLLVPHMMRSVTGPDNKKLIPVSMLAGAILLLCADTITRAFLPVEVPIGVITALIGGPFFCYIFKKKQNKLN